MPASAMPAVGVGTISSPLDRLVYPHNAPANKVTSVIL